FALSSAVRAQDAPFMLAAVLRNNAGSNLAWEFITSRWPELLKRYSSGLSMVARIIGTCDNFASTAQAQKMAKFFRANPAPGAARSVQQVLEKIRGNAAWLAADGPAIAAWLEQYQL
ncbi:MAG TPA: ERAP1-like C-terminal domain-containing protein, partial [Patescibacteria group bacterium]|nr:ERAP1-like C-terminal domain-containing protein [Patescibacteria group bacterium]